jgi:hypothetical protein
MTEVSRSRCASIERRRSQEERYLFAYANDDVGIAGSEVADGEVHPPHHGQLQQPNEMVQHGDFPLLHH